MTNGPLKLAVNDFSRVEVFELCRERGVENSMWYAFSARVGAAEEKFEVAVVHVVVKMTNDSLSFIITYSTLACLLM